MSNDSSQPPEEDQRKGGKGLSSQSGGTLRAYPGQLEERSREEQQGDEGDTQPRRARRQPESIREQPEGRGLPSEKRRRDLSQEERDQQKEPQGQERRPMKASMPQQGERVEKMTRKVSSRKQDNEKRLAPGIQRDAQREREQRNVQREQDVPSGLSREQRSVQRERNAPSGPLREQRSEQRERDQPSGLSQRQDDRPGGRVEEQKRQIGSSTSSLRGQRVAQEEGAQGKEQRPEAVSSTQEEKRREQSVQSEPLKEKRSVQRTPSQEHETVLGSTLRAQEEKQRRPSTQVGPVKEKRSMQEMSSQEEGMMPGGVLRAQREKWREQVTQSEPLKEQQSSSETRQSRSTRNPGQPPARSSSSARESRQVSDRENVVSARKSGIMPPPSTAAQRVVKQVQSRSAHSGRVEAQSSVSAHEDGYRTQSFIRRVRRLSGKMVALASNYIPPHPQEPVVPLPQVSISSVWTYAPSELAPATSPRKRRWKRSRTQRVAYQMRQRRHRLHHQHLGNMRLGLLTTVALLLLLLSGTFGGSAYGYSYYQQQVPIVESLAQLNMPQDTRIYDRNGVLLYEAYDHNTNDLNAGRRIAVSYDQVPLVMQNAIIAAEDSSFWTNSGIDPAAILRAASSGNGGGSTITQQVIKNLTHNSSYTLTRKITEAAMALALTQQYPKWQILQMYFNIAPFGAYDNGVETAAENLFHLKRTCNTKTYQCTAAISQIAVNARGKSDPLLGLARASVLAAIPNNPSIYDPSVDQINVQRALARQDYVLNQMMDQNMTVDGSTKGAPITPAVIKQVEAITAGMPFTSYNSVKQAPYFVDWIMYQVARVLDPEDLSNGYALFQTSGLNIYTTIDVNLEKYVETSIHDNLDTEEYQLFPMADAGYKIISQALNVNDAAGVVMDAKNGEILAMDGGADYNSPDGTVGGEYNTAAPPDDGNGYDPTASTYNPADLSHTPTIGRQPGSTMKPIIYATAFEDGWYPNMVLPDQMTFFPQNAPAGTAIPTGAALKRVRNSDGSYSYPDVSNAASAVKLYAPTDYGQTYHNYTSGKQATISYGTSNSFNITVLRAMAYVGPQNVLNMAQRLGIDTLHAKDSSISGIAWALGTNNIPVVQMVGAYQVFAHYGSRIPPQGILDIYDNYGHDLYHYDPNHPPSSQVISPQVAFMITSMLRDQPDRYLEFGNDPDLSFSDFDSSCLYEVVCNYQMAAKTGTSSSFVDNWTLGYTPDVVVGVWAGNANGQAMANNTVGITGAAPIFSDIMESVSGFCPTRHVVDDCPKYNFEFSSNPTRQFSVPDGLVESDVSGSNGLQGTGSGYMAYMLPNEMPTQTGVAPTTGSNKDNNKSSGDTTNPGHSIIGSIGGQ